VEIGFTLSSEEFGPNRLAYLGFLAEKYGFKFVMVSDHYHPWIDKEGHSPFVWNVIGALSIATEKISVGIGVNAPIIRYHPAIIAQAAATSQVQLEGRFILGVGTGENLNEHITGSGWPPIGTRRKMLVEAIDIMRLLWKGGYQNYEGKFYRVEDARIYTMANEKIPILISAFGKNSAKMAGTLGDGFITTSPDKSLVDTFKSTGKTNNRPIYGQMSIVYGKNKKAASDLLLKLWPLAGLPHPLNTELRLPSYFENVSKMVDHKDLSSKYVLGHDKEKTIEALKTYENAGFTHVYLHNIGPKQEEFLKWASRNILPSYN
jgi:coenzyme F420-dependent glucose-6-phosphate dehydrogenase